LLAELIGTLAKPYFRRHITDEVVARLLELLHLDAAVSPLTVAVQGVATHPEDDLVLATAVSSQAQPGHRRRQTPAAGRLSRRDHRQSSRLPGGAED
jgi:hypothetical protein